jgi:hypothetical protein
MSFRPGSYGREQPNLRSGSRTPDLGVDKLGGPPLGVLGSPGRYLGAVLIIAGVVTLNWPIEQVEN